MKITILLEIKERRILRIVTKKKISQKLHNKMKYNSRNKFQMKL